MATTVPFSLALTGADLTGVSGTGNRTYTIVNSGILEGGLSIIIQGVHLHLTNDYTWANPVITFLNIIDNSDVIGIVYFTQATSAAGSLSFSSTTSLTRFMGLLGTVPNKDTNTKEEVGTGDGTTLTYWLNHVGVLADSYTLYYGATEAAATSTMTETTHYTIDLDTSKITLTTAGRTLVSGSIIYAAYQRNISELLNAELTLALSAAESKVRRDTDTTFADGTATSPTYTKITGE